MERENQCKSIYRETFCDPDTVFEDVLFETCYKYCRTLEVDGKVVSMLFALPCSIDFSGKKKKGIYLYAAATNKEYRKQGLMTKLIENLKNSTGSIIILRPANEGLIDFYKKSGFKTARTLNRAECDIKVTPKDGYKDLVLKIYNDSENLDDLKNDFTVMYYSEKDLEIDNIYFVNSME